MTTKIYKIVTQSQWGEAVKSGVFEGAPVDLADGYIHFSTAEQVRETAAKHFHGQTNLLLVTFDADGFGDKLKWEPSRGGALFPHLYAELKTDDAVSIVELADLPDGGHRFPENF
ncbi:MAG: DUF952 domain-containing protein [Pseudomonadota bacterium]